MLNRRIRLALRSIVPLALGAATALPAQQPAARPVATRTAAAANSATRAAPFTAPIDLAMLSGLRYRSIGPARGGRVTTVTGVPSQPYTFYMGSTGGGVWKTIDAGQTLGRTSPTGRSASGRWARSTCRSPTPTRSTSAPAPMASARTSRSATASTSPATPERPGRTSDSRDVGQHRRRSRASVEPGHRVRRGHRQPVQA